MIASVADLCALLGLSEGDDADTDALLEQLLTRVEALFLAACGRADRPFLDAATEPITEHVDGTGFNAVFTERPVTSVTQITLGDADDPRQTILASALVVLPGRRLLRAKDASVVFGTVDEPGAVHITYTPAAEAPEDAKQAILRAAAALYLQRGAEDVRAESEGGIRSELASPFEDPSWHLAVATHREPQLG